MARGKGPPKSKQKVGYGNPPLHTRFRKGQSGNPSGRPRGGKGVQAEKLILKEAYRKVNVREGESVVSLPALQAVLRGIVVNAAKGNGPAQRTLIAAVQAIEQKIAAKEAARPSRETNAPEMSDLELARRIAFTLELGARSNEAQQRAARDKKDEED